MKHVRLADYRVVPCEACEGERHLYFRAAATDEYGNPMDCDDGPCPYCEGTGGELIAVQPITMEDLEDAS